ncbi:ABC transporter ATP-binding protein [Microlunatus speluncae]|uniref:ABC transporter ATP-binding protein n=1 Tax=Microlunatus speluncae TaxID=2594267 RepID=UPI001266207E|nr:ABC transporter ATP-binding protein [Microlunatus speluncae]
MRTEPNLLEVRGLATHFRLQEGLVRAVEAVDLDVRAGETLAIVGESGCGKSITARSILQLVDPPGKVVAGKINYRRADGTVIDLAGLDPKGKAIRELRGREIAMVFQEPMSSLSPVHTIGSQIMESILEHEPVSKAEARDRAIESLREVGIPRPEQRVDAYTFQLSGGMRQRAMIAMALACRPRLLIADEPTTALDVTIQAQILDLFRELQERHRMAVIFITHDLGVVAEVADRVAVMYLGLVVEHCDVDDLFYAPRHPYTAGLLRSMPMVGPRSKQRLATIPGSVPHPYARPHGCPYHPRCDRLLDGRCDNEFPIMIDTATPDGDGGRSVRCLLYSSAESVTEGVGEK